MPERILVVDDEKNQRLLIAGFLQKRGYEVETAEGGDQALARFADRGFALVLTDLRMAGGDGVTLLRGVKQLNPLTAVILMSAFGTVETAVEAMKAGADDFLLKPVNLEQLEGLVRRALDRAALVRENRELRARLAERFRFDAIVGDSGALQEALNIAGRAAQSKATILIRGESGTGKGLLANAIHLASPRAVRPLVEINCAALSPGVLESELFGHEKGAFTGADRRRIGRFEAADGGTLFIDEVGDIPLEAQVKLLGVLQTGEFTRVGGNEPVKVDVRVVAATHRDLEAWIKDGRFREDLYYRLNVVAVVVPPLRERRADIPRLAEAFIARYAKENEKAVEGVTSEAMDCLVRYDYPGNVRELENAIERAVVLARGPVIGRDDLPATIRACAGASTAAANLELGKATLPAMVEALERQAIRQAMEAAGGVQTKAAELLGINERNLRYKIEKYGLK